MITCVPPASLINQLTLRVENEIDSKRQHVLHLFATIIVQINSVKVIML